MAIDRKPATSLSVFGLLLVFGFLAGCDSSKLPRPEVHNEEPGPVPKGAAADDIQPLVSSMAMRDPEAAHQLISGFYAIEDNAWRWTARTFSARLKTPPGASLSGATISLRLSVPDALTKSGPVTLTASAEGKELKSEVFRSAGQSTFSADVAAGLLKGPGLQVDFALSRGLPPSPSGDRRELGIIAMSLEIAGK